MVDMFYQKKANVIAEWFSKHLNFSVEEPIELEKEVYAKEQSNQRERSKEINSLP